MTTYTIELSDVEQKAMEYISTDVDFWIQNAVHERARVAIEEMVEMIVKTTLAEGGSISGTKEDLVMNSNLPDANERNRISWEMAQSTMKEAGAT